MPPWRATYDIPSRRPYQRCRDAQAPARQCVPRARKAPAPMEVWEAGCAS